VHALTPEAAQHGEALLWQLYDHITAPTLLLRGAESDLLTPEVAQAMQLRGPRAQRLDLPGVGHAPTLVADATCAKKVLGWEPQFTDVRDIIQHAWSWEKKFPW
jgi:pimeloyl-ACP methyl ester carboxylesterase